MGIAGTGIAMESPPGKSRASAGIARHSLL
jgi:hypothetical protein